MKNGILLIDKEKGFTSRDVVNLISKRLGTKKVGHTGTLDPLATGLMIVCVNKATSLVNLITSEDKEYVAKVKLGIKTDTLDITGNIIDENYNYILKKNDLENVLASFKGNYLQEVPLYSAIKINGKRLYEYARGKIPVELPKRMVSIKEISLMELNEDNFTFKVKVSKGTYIRSLIRDIGDKLNILMTMEELRRTEINHYNVLKAKKVNDITEEDIIPVEDFLNLERIYVDSELEKKIINGVRLKNIYNSKMIMFFNKKNKLLAIYEKNDNNEMCLYKLF